MSDAAGALHARYVILPWTQHYDASAREAQQAQRRVARDVDILKVRGEGIAVGGRQIDAAGPARFRSAARRPLAPPLLAAGLPARPLPSIPESDRSPLATETLMSAAVAVDVLTSRTQSLQARGDILHRLTSILLEIGGLGGIDATAVERLLRHAASQAGSNRAALSRGLTRAAPGDRGDAARFAPQARGNGVPSQSSRPTPPPTSPGDTNVAARRSTPEGVAAALRDLEAAAQIVVREAVLLLDAHEPVSYRQA